MGRKNSLGDEAGNSAVEFALLAPVLALVCLGLIDGWSIASFTLYMRAGVGSAANLYLQGAGDDSAVRALVLQNWQSRPDDAAVTIARAYKCGTTAVTSITLCTGSKAPAVYITIQATGTWVAPFEIDLLRTGQAMTHQQVIRVR